VAISGTELFSRLPETRDEPSIGLPELLTYPGAQRMEERSGGSLRVLRPIVGVLTQNRRDAQRLASRSLGPGCGFLFDLMDQVKGAFSPDRLRKVLPAWEKRQVQRLDVRILETVEGLSPVAGGVCPASLGKLPLGVGSFLFQKASFRRDSGSFPRALGGSFSEK
jgi:hypothetical protein